MALRPVRRRVRCLWPRARGSPARLPGVLGADGLLVRIRALAARWRKTTVPDPTAEAAKDLIQRHFGPWAEIDRRYVGDITYVMTWEGWAYLATVIDLASHRVVGWALADHMRTELVEEALEMAFVTRQPPPGTIFHSDRGCQYTSKDSAQSARAIGMALSVGMARECWDNAGAESFFATIKRELIDTRAWPRREGLRRAVFDYIEGWYNTRRLRSSLGYRSPAEMGGDPPQR
jgi:transposase InsO family protein